METEKKNSSKKVWITNLRAIACMMVIMIHVIAGWLDNTGIVLTGARNVLDNIILQPLIRWAVPVFIMISGCLLLNPKKDMSIKKILKYIKKMLIILLIFGFTYCFIECIFDYGFNNLWKNIYMSLFNLIQGKSWGVMWYIYMLIGLYIVTPILRQFIKYSSDKEIKIVTILLTIFSILIPSINFILKINITSFYLQGFEYITLYLLGYILAFKLNQRHVKYVYLGGVVGFAGNLILLIFKLPFEQLNFFEVLIAMSIFTYFSQKQNIKESKFLTKISNDSLGIYLIHTFWLNLINKGFNIYPSVLPIAVGEIIFFIIALTLSVLSVEIMKRIPYLKKII